MKINISNNVESDFNVGDIVLTSDGDCFLITYDSKTTGFVATSLKTYLPSDSASTLKGLIFYITDDGLHRITRICKGETIEIKEI